MLQVKRDFFLQSHFEYFCLTSFLHSVLTSHSATKSEVSNFVPRSFMMSEARWMAAENVVFFSKPNILVIKLPVINMNYKFCSTSGNPDNQAFRVRNMCHCLSTLNQSIPVACRVF